MTGYETKYKVEVYRRRGVCGYENFKTKTFRHKEDAVFFARHWEVIKGKTPKIIEVNTRVLSPLSEGIDYVDTVRGQSAK